MALGADAVLLTGDFRRGYGVQAAITVSGRPAKYVLVASAIAVVIVAAVVAYELSTFR